MSIVVSDTSPLRALGHLGHLSVLQALYSEVLLPPAVALELRQGSRVPPLFASSVPGLRVVAPSDGSHVAALLLTLNAGEAGAIALAKELAADLVMIDESKGRAAVRAIGLRPIGALGVLVQAREHGLVGPLKPMIESLRRDINFAVSDGVIERILRAVKEL